MNFDKFTERSRGYIQSAQSAAARSNHQQLTPEHLFKILVEDQEGLATKLVEACGGNVTEIYQLVQKELNRLPSIEGSGAGQIYLSPQMSKVLSQAEDLTDNVGDSYVTAEYLLLSLSMSPDTASSKILTNAGVNPNALNEAINKLRKGRGALSPNAEDGYDALL